jgi:hypothetical protein
MKTPFILSVAKDREPMGEVRSFASLHPILRAFGAKDKSVSHDEKTS